MNKFQHEIGSTVYAIIWDENANCNIHKARIEAQIDYGPKTQAAYYIITEDALINGGCLVKVDGSDIFKTTEEAENAAIVQLGYRYNAQLEQVAADAKKLGLYKGRRL